MTAQEAPRNAPKRGRLTRGPAPELKSAKAFARYSREYANETRSANAQGIAQAISRRHCAGFAAKATGQDMLEALRAGPERAGTNAQAVLWMLETVTIPECTKLVVRCGVQYEEIARYVRTQRVRRPGLVRYLNQFTVGP